MPNAPAGRLGFDGADLLHIVGHEITDAVFHAVADVLIGLVVAVKVGAAEVVARLKGGVDLAGGHHVDAHLFFLHDLVDALEGICLAGVQGTGAVAEMLLERGGVDPAVLTDLVLVHQVQGGAVLPGQLHRVLPGKSRRPLSETVILSQIIWFFLFFRFHSIVWGEGEPGRGALRPRAPLSLGEGRKENISVTCLQRLSRQWPCPASPFHH